MGTLFKSASPITGFRYYFTLLMGVCRGPVDELYLITSADIAVWDGAGVDLGTDPFSTFFSSGGVDPSPISAAPTAYGGGSITDNTEGAIIFRPNLYGGDGREGGLVGQFDVQMGGATQTLTQRVSSALAGLRISAMRGVMTILFDGEVCANNPYPKPFKFRVRRALKGWDGPVWYPAKAVIAMTDASIPTSTQVASSTTGGVYTVTNGDYTSTVTTALDGTQTYVNHDKFGNVTYTAVPMGYNSIYAMNGAHIIYECCTNRDWGRGLSRSLINDASFTASADRLYTENFGLCMKWARADDVDTFIQTVLDHIGAVLYTDKVTGFLCLNLLRADYVLAALPVFDDTHGLLSVSVSETGAQDTSPNEVIVQYNSPVLNMDKETRVQNIAAVDAQGSIFSTTKHYPGLPTSQLATLVAQRDLKIFSSGLKRVTFKLDRRGYLLVPGAVVIVNAPDQGLPNAVLRLATIEDSIVTDGTMTFGAVQDVFNQPLVPFISQTPSTFIEPDLNPYPVAIELQNMTEVTYRDLVKIRGAPFADALAATSGFSVVVAAAPTPASYAFDLESGVAHVGSGTFSPFAMVGTSRFAKMSTLDAAIGRTQTVIRVTGTIRPRDVAIGSALSIESYLSNYFTQEFVRVDAITQDVTGQVSITIARGCVDTPSLAHAKGAQVWAYDQVGSGDTTEYTHGDYVATRIRTKTSRGLLPANQAVVSHGGIYSRPVRPYAPGDFRVNGLSPDLMPDALGPTLVFTWNHRHRKLQADRLVGETEASIGPETGVVYLLRIQGTGGVYSQGTGAAAGLPGFSANTFTFTGAMADSATIVSGPMRVFMSAERVDSSTPLGECGTWRFNLLDFVYSRAGGPIIVPVPPTTGFGTNFGNLFGQ